MSESLASLTPGPFDTSPETEATVLCPVHKFVLDCHAKKEAAPESRPDAAKEIKNDSRHCKYTK